MRVILLAVIVAIFAYASATLTAVQKDGIIKAHNAARSAAHPSLPALVWSDNLAKVAAQYSAKCVSGGSLMAHNSNRKNNPLLAAETKKYPNIMGNYFGENIYASTAAYSDFAPAVNSWVAEKKDYNYSANKCAAGKMCGHYTQAVWKTTRAVGCAYVQCSNIRFGYTFLCNYFPGGNINGARPF
jgi:pathogenesis-related protein 1